MKNKKLLLILVLLNACATTNNSYVPSDLKRTTEIDINSGLSHSEKGAIENATR